MTAGVLIVGLGGIGCSYDLGLDPGRFVLTHARACSQHPRFSIVGGVDPDSARRQDFSARYGAPAYEDLEAALRLLQPQVVVIATPTPSHFSTLSRVLRLSRPEAILCEKPLSYELSDALEMVNRCENAGVRLLVNYFRRSLPGLLEIKRRIRCGEIDGDLKGVVWYSKGFLHNGSHFFNLIEDWLGPARTSVMVNPGRLLSDGDSEPDCRVEFEAGEIMFLAAREEDFSHYTIELIARNGRLSCDNGCGRIRWQPVEEDAALVGFRSLGSFTEEVDSGMDRYQWHVTEQLARSMDGLPHDLCTGRAALTTLQSMQRILNGT